MHKHRVVQCVLDTISPSLNVVIPSYFDFWNYISFGWKLKSWKDLVEAVGDQ